MLELAGTLTLIALIASAVLYARRANLHAAALERQLMALRDQFAEYRLEDHQRAQQAAERLEYRVKEALRDESVQPIQAELRELSSQMRSRAESLAGDVQSLSGREAALSAQMTAACARIEKITDAVEIVTRKPLEGFPIDAARLETKTEDELLKLPESVAILRP